MNDSPVRSAFSSSTPIERGSSADYSSSELSDSDDDSQADRKEAVERMMKSSGLRASSSTDESDVDETDHLLAKTNKPDSSQGSIRTQESSISASESDRIQNPSPEIHVCEATPEVSPVDSNSFPMGPSDSSSAEDDPHIDQDDILAKEKATFLQMGGDARFLQGNTVNFEDSSDEDMEEEYAHDSHVQPGTSGFSAKCSDTSSDTQSTSSLDYSDMQHATQPTSFHVEDHHIMQTKAVAEDHPPHLDYASSSSDSERLDEDVKVPAAAAKH
jgi:hypothetical protein